MPVAELGPATGQAFTRAAIAGIREVLVTADLDTPVPGCPGWTLAALAGHLGEIHRWVCGAIVEGHPRTPAPEVPRGRDALVAWYDDGAATLLDLLARTDPAAPCWTLDRSGAAASWSRRQAHEHAVHAVDARAAVGTTWPLDADLARDGIDEVARLFFPRQVRLGRIAPLTRSLLVQPDGAATGHLLAGDGLDPRAAAARGPAEATVSGPAEALYLLLWGRTGLDDARLRLDGDPGAARAVLGTAIVP